MFVAIDIAWLASLVSSRFGESVIPSRFRFPGGDTAGQIVKVALLPAALAGGEVRLEEFDAMVVGCIECVPGMETA